MISFRQIILLIGASVLLMVTVQKCAPSAPGVGESTKPETARFRMGLDVLADTRFALLRNKRVGLVVNHTSVDENGVHIIDLLNSESDITIGKIFVPEHGFKGILEAGKKVPDGIEPRTGAQIISLYGDHKKPSEQDLSDLDLLIYDIQDVGSRYYTYISTLTYVMEAAALRNIPVMVLDRPNPIGVKVEGPKLDMAFRSFVGLHPIPTRYGMTVGELAAMINGEKWLNGGVSCSLNVIKMVEWRKKASLYGSGDSWVPPSPNIPDDTTALIYNGFCLLEGTNISEGRGTEHPFKIFGAPWMDGLTVTDSLNAMQLSGVKFFPVDFTPVEIAGKSRWPKYKNKGCSGSRIVITDPEAFHPMKTAVSVLFTVKKLYPEEFETAATKFLDKLYGSDALRLALAGGERKEILFARWEKDCRRFEEIRGKYSYYR